MKLPMENKAAHQLALQFSEEVEMMIKTGTPIVKIISVLVV